MTSSKNISSISDRKHNESEDENTTYDTNLKGDQLKEAKQLAALHGHNLQEDDLKGVETIDAKKSAALLDSLKKKRKY